MDLKLHSCSRQNNCLIKKIPKHLLQGLVKIKHHQKGRKRKKNESHNDISDVSGKCIGKRQAFNGLTRLIPLIVWPCFLSCHQISVERATIQVITKALHANPRSYQSVWKIMVHRRIPAMGAPPSTLYWVEGANFEKCYFETFWDAVKTRSQWRHQCRLTMRCCDTRHMLM